MDPIEVKAGDSVYYASEDEVLKGHAYCNERINSNPYACFLITIDEGPDEGATISVTPEDIKLTKEEANTRLLDRAISELATLNERVTKVTFLIRKMEGVIANDGIQTKKV